MKKIYILENNDILYYFLIEFVTLFGFYLKKTRVELFNYVIHIMYLYVCQDSLLYVTIFFSILYYYIITFFC